MSKKRRTIRGRGILLWMAGLFLLGQFAGGFLLDRVLPQVRFPFLYRQLRRLDEQPQKPNVVCLGSSRFGLALAGDYVTQRLRRMTGDPDATFFNASVPAGDLLVAELMLQHLLERGVQPKIAVIELCPDMINHRNDWLKVHIHRHLLWQDIPSYLREITRTGNLGRLLLNRFFPLSQHRDTICVGLEAAVEGKLAQWLRAPTGKLDFPADGPTVDQDYSPLEKAPPPLTEAQLVNMQPGLRDAARCLRGFRPGGNSVRALERILDLCREKGITPVLVGVPLSSPHRALYTPEIEASYQLFVTGIVAKHGCRYVDYRALVPDAFFGDNHHVTVDGTRLFSRTLTDEVLAEKWRHLR